MHKPCTELSQNSSFFPGTARCLAEVFKPKQQQGARSKMQNSSTLDVSENGGFHTAKDQLWKMMIHQWVFLQPMGVQAKSTCCGLWPENFASSIYKVSKGVKRCLKVSMFAASCLLRCQGFKQNRSVAKTVGKASSSSPLHWPDDNSFPWQNHANQSENSSQDSGNIQDISGISTGMEH